MERAQTSSGGVERGARGPSAAAVAPWPYPAGWWALVPGLSQWRWGEGERAAVLLGSFVTGLLAAVFAWGTLPGLGLLGFTVAAHLASAADALGRSPMPALGRRADRGVVMGWLAMGGYGPVVSAAVLTAWPGTVLDLSNAGYLVDRSAYLREAPRPGDVVWFRPTEWAEPRLGRVMAVPGQTVEWSGGRCRIDGRSPGPEAPPQLKAPSLELSYRVPDGHLLVRAEPASNAADGGPLLVSNDEVVGRAWAQYYPVRDRRWIH